jgi:flagellar hook-length control protein FliK
MDLAIIDSFGRTDVAPKSGPRSSDDANGSFADILDTRLREPEPARERPSAPEARETPEARDAHPPAEARPAPDAEAESEPASLHSDPVAAKPRVKPKGERDKASSDSTSEPKAPKAGESTEAAAAPAPTPTPKAAPANGAVAAVVAELLNSTGDTQASETPMGLLVAAVVTPTGAPQPAANAQILSLLADRAPVPQPQTATPAPTPAAATPETPAAPLPTPGFAPELKAAAPEAVPATPANPTPAATTPVTPTVPADVMAQTPAAATAAASAPAIAAAAAATTESTKQPDEPAAEDMLLEALSGEDGTGLLATVTTTTTGQAAAPRPAPALATPSSYAAQLASQAPIAETPVVQTGDVAKETLLEAALADKAMDLSELTADGEELAAIKPQDTLPTHTASEPATTRNVASVEATAQRNAARPAALPIVEQVAVRINKAISDGIDRISVKLNPAELGQIEIRMEIGPDGKFNAVFAADRPQTVELLQRDARELARSLQEAGLRTDAGSLSFNLRGQNQGQQNGTGFAGLHESTGVNGVDGLVDAAPLPAGLYSSSGAANGRVDIRV